MSTRTLVVAAILCAGCTDRVAEQIALLDHADLETRLAAIELLRLTTTSDPRVEQAMAHAIEDPAPAMRGVAIDWFGSSGKPAEHSPIVLASLDDPDPDVRFAAAIAAIKLDPQAQRPAEVLSRAMLDGEPRVFVAVGKLGDKAAWATPTLAKLLRHRDTRLRMIAARTLGQLGPAAGDATAALRSALNDPAPGVRDQAQLALDRAAPNGLDDSP